MAHRLLLFWLLLLVAATSIGLGTLPLFDADEGRNAEVAREMAATNDYVMPRLDTLPYLDKPIVYFAAEAAAMEVLGPSELAARLPAFLFTLATAALLFWFAQRLWGGEAGAVAAIAFLSMPLTLAFARTVIFDSALTFFVVVALIAFYFAVEQQSMRWGVLAWAAIGVAMITKGPVTFVLVLFVAIPFAWRRHSVSRIFPIVGIVVFFAVIAPWLWGMTRVIPEFLRYVLVTETAERLATKALKRTGPPWYFVPYLIGGALPWSLLALFNWKRVREVLKGRRPAQQEPEWSRGWYDDATLFLLLWIAIPFVFFSLSQSKRPQYILPLMPALALLVARIWPQVRVRLTGAILAIFGLLLMIAPLFLHRARMHPEIAATAPQTALALGMAFAVAGAGALWSRRREWVLIALSLPVAALPLATDALMRSIGERRSAKSFAAELAPHLQPDTEIVGVEAFTGSMAFYLRQPITVVTADGSELTSNYLVRRYEKFTSNPASPLKPLPYFERSLSDATRPRIYILRNDDRARRQLLESRGWKVVADGAHDVAYGP